MPRTPSSASRGLGIGLGGVTGGFIATTSSPGSFTVLFLVDAATFLVFVSAGDAVFELLPVFAKNEASVSEKRIGLIFLVNTVVIVVLQLPIAKLLEGRRRMRALAS